MSEPATPLPWEYDPDDEALYGTSRVQDAQAYDYIGSTMSFTNESEDAAYIVHAANAYPQLVEALREHANGGHAKLCDARWVPDGPCQCAAGRARALLESLSETS